jgi:hypothetical protein
LEEFWSLTYVLIIRKGFKDKTYGMPLAALCANISWEAIFSFIHPATSPQIYINYAWFVLDGIIVYEFLRFGKKEFQKLSSLLFYGVFLFTLAMAFCSVLFITHQFNDWQGAYAAFGQNLMMSVLFINMFLNRNDLRGQSFYIALFKLLGTGIISLAFYLYQPISHGSFLMPFLYISTFVCDALYTSLVYLRSNNMRKLSRIPSKVR